jgi:hypothetical protein
MGWNNNYGKIPLFSVRMGRQANDNGTGHKSLPQMWICKASKAGEINF